CFSVRPRRGSTATSPRNFFATHPTQVRMRGCSRLGCTRAGRYPRPVAAACAVRPKSALEWPVSIATYTANRSMSMLLLNRRQVLPLVSLAAWHVARAQAFDHRYAPWEALLKKHVRWLPDQKQSRVAYAGMAADRAALKSVLEGFSSLT